MRGLSIIFFGSFQTYSVQVLAALTKHFRVIAVVTTPPKAAGRHLTVTPTPVEEFARSHRIPVYPLDHLRAIPATMPKPDFFVVAGYGKCIPASWLTFPRIMAVNAHQSLLPDYRGAFPAEWAILRGEEKTGVTILRLSAELDTGEILVQESLPITNDDTRLTLYHKLYDLSAKLLVTHLPPIATGQEISRPQPAGTYFYARRLTKQDGFVDWKEFDEAMRRNTTSLNRKLRAFAGWPGVWTRTPGGKRLILIALKPAPIVQLEGKKPVSFAQFASAYLRE